MMRRVLWLVAALGLSGESAAQDPAAGAPTAMAQAARSFLATLDVRQRGQASLPFDSTERSSWSFVPGARRGLPLGQMPPASRQAALGLLQGSLSEGGYGKVDAIVRLEEVLFALEGWSGRDSGLYYVTVFGEPAERGAWGWRYEGHHVSLHWTLLDGKVVGSSPQFLGANPAEVRAGPRKGSRALAAEEDLARALVASLDPGRRAQAVLADVAPRDIVTGNARRAAALEVRGIAYTNLSASQQGLLLSLIQEYASTQTPAVAQTRLARVRAELERVHFAWMGGLERGQGHYYRVQGPSFLIEYDNTQNGANHVHCVWREFHGDWGEDVLDEHYRTASHHRDGGGGS